MPEPFRTWGCRAIAVGAMLYNALVVGVILRFQHPDWTETQLFLNGWMNVLGVLGWLALLIVWERRQRPHA